MMNDEYELYKKILHSSCEKCSDCRGFAAHYDAGYTRCDLHRHCDTFDLIQKAKKFFGFNDEEEMSILGGKWYLIDKLIEKYKKQ